MQIKRNYERCETEGKPNYDQTQKGNSGQVYTRKEIK